MSVDVLTFGCRLNTYESEVIKRHAIAAGLADVVVAPEKSEKKGDTDFGKGDAATPERVTLDAVKGDTAGRAIRNEKQEQKQDQNAVILDGAIPYDPWKPIQEQLRRTMNLHTWETWLRPLHFSHEADGLVFVRIPISQFHYAEKFLREFPNLVLGTDEEIAALRGAVPWRDREKAS